MYGIGEPDGSFSAYKDNNISGIERANRTEHIAVYWPSAENRCKSTHFLSDLEPQLDATFLNPRLYTNIFKYLQIGDARTCCFVSSLYRPSLWCRFFSP